MFLISFQANKPKAGINRVRTKYALFFEHRQLPPVIFPIRTR
jgi:hypothetical protein